MTHPDRRPTPATRWTAVALVAPTVVMLTGCGADPNGYNDNDVAYASDVTRHHAQTLQVLDLSLGRESLDPDLGALADETRKRLFDEVNGTQKWLKANDQPVPRTALQHSNGDDQPYDTSIPGMLTADQLHDLAQVEDAEFQAAWLDALIAHEEGAVEMAQAAVDDAQNADLTKAAQADLNHHRQQLDRLRKHAGT